MYGRVVSLRAVAVVAFLAAVSVAPGAANVPIPRLIGAFPTKLTVTQIKNVPKVRAGTSTTATWRFSPQCATGACQTVLARVAILPGSSAAYQYLLKPLGPRRYAGRLHVAVAACTLPSGKQVANAYVVDQTFDLTVTKVGDGGVVAGYRGSGHSTQTPTAAGKAAGCRPVEIRASFASG
jgi:hypothetical protein